MWKVLSFQPRQKDELPCVYSKPVSSAIRRLCSSCAYLNCFFGNFFWIENVIPYSPFYNPPFQAHVSCISEKLTKPHLPRTAQATNVPHNHWRYRTAPMGSPTMAPKCVIHSSLVSCVQATQFRTQILLLQQNGESKKNFQNVLMLQKNK